MKRICSTAENKALHSEIMKKRMSDPKALNKLKRLMKKRWEDPKYVAAQRKRGKQIWSDPKKLEAMKQKVSAANKGHGRKQSKITRKRISDSVKMQYATGLKEVPKRTFDRFLSGYTTSKKCKQRIFYRCSWELFFIQLLTSSSIVKKFEWEPFGIPYKFKREKHTYFPDVLITLKSKEKWLVEIKGENRPETKAKYKAAFKYCEEHGYSWAIINEKPIQPITEYLQ